MKKKLLKVERYIGVYNNPWDDKGYIDEYLLDIKDIDLLKIVPPEPDDPLLYDPLELDSNKVNDLIRFCTKKLVPDFQKYNYVLQTFGVYEW